jgi:DNA replication protein DnaC
LKIYNQIRDGKIPRAVFVGNTGLGKTHLAKALGYAVCQSGGSAFFTKASTIINCLAAAKATHDLENELKKYRRPELLIIDELGYVTMDLEASNLFFQVISDRHERNLGTIVTSNFAFGHWNQIFATDSVAVVIAERLTAAAEVFYLEGESYPQAQKKKK